MSERTSAISLVDGWLDWLRASRGRDARTVRMYRRIVGEFVATVDRPLGELSAGEIERWLQRPRQGRARGNVASAATQRRDASAIRGFFQWAVDSGLLAHDPSRLVSTPTVRNRQPRPISDEMWIRLWGVADGADAILLGLGFFGGLRREELTRLRVSHVDVGGRRVVNFVRKGGGEDVLPLGTLLDVFADRLPHLGAERLWPLIEGTAVRRRGDQWLVGWSDVGRPSTTQRTGLAPGQLHPQHLNSWLDRLCRAAEVGHVHPHQLRHSTATNLIRAGVPLPIVSSMLNHSNVVTTMRYVRSGGDELAEWLGRSRPLP